MLSTSYIVTEDQLLTAKLYNTSINASIKKRRLLSWLMIPVLYGVLGYIFWATKGGKMIYFFISFSALWIVLYPFWEGNRFKKSYRNGLKRTMKFDETLEISFSENIKIKTGEKEEVFSYQELTAVVEIDQYYLMLFVNERTLSIPKEKLTAEILEYLFSKNISITQKLYWKWR